MLHWMNWYAVLLGMVASLPAPLPLLEDRDRFPSREIAKENLECCRQYRDYAHARVPRSSEDFVHRREIIERANHLYDCWDWLHAAQGGEGKDEAYWRRSLKRLRELLGEEDYFAGRMPVLP